MNKNQNEFLCALIEICQRRSSFTEFIKEDPSTLRSINKYINRISISMAMINDILYGLCFIILTAATAIAKRVNIDHPIANPNIFFNTASSDPPFILK